MCVHVSNLFPTGVSTYTSKSKWVAQYDCVCGTTLKCVTTDAIENHLKGKQHAEAMAPQAPEFQDCTCDYGCKTSCKTNTKWSAPAVSVAKKLAALSGLHFWTMWWSLSSRIMLLRKRSVSPIDQRPAACDIHVEPSPEDEDMDVAPTLCPGFLSQQFDHTDILFTVSLCSANSLTMDPARSRWSIRKACATPDWGWRRGYWS